MCLKQQQKEAQEQVIKRMTMSSGAGNHELSTLQSILQQKDAREVSSQAGEVNSLGQSQVGRAAVHF
jgi:hypothetical protein